MSEIKDSDFAPEPSNADGTVNIDLPDEIQGITSADPPKQTLGDWLADTTSKNTYGPASGLERNPAFQGQIERPPIVTGGESSSARGFFDDVLDQASSYFENITAGGTPDTREGGTFTPTQLATLLEKNNPQSADEAKTGNTLLSSVEGDPFNTAGTTNYGDSSKTALQGRINGVLRYNRFSPGGESPYIQDREYSRGIWANQTKFGEFDENGKTPSLEDLAKVGLSLMLRATGDNSDPDSQGTGGAMLTGILPQLAMKKVDVVDLDAAATLDSVAGITTEGSTFNYIDEKGIRRKGSATEPLDAESKKSFGQLNSYLEPFGGPLPTSMILLAVLSALATLVAGVIIGLFLDLIILIFPNVDATQPGQIYPLGAASGTPAYGRGGTGQSIKKFLNMPVLRSGEPFWKCMSLGAVQFYSKLLGVSAGYYTIVSRAAIRDVEQIADAFSNMPSITDPIGFIAGLFMIMEAFATSTTFNFLNTIAKIGDIGYLTGGWGGKGPWTQSPYPDGIPPEQIKPTLAVAHTKSRTLVAGQTDDSTSLSWRFGSTPSMHLLPAGFDTYVKRKNWPGLSLKNAFTSEADSTDNPNGYEKIQRMPAGKFRIDQEEVDRIENILDTSYMPFYLHDVRTNEILSFHAFFEAITDSFAPKWKEEEGFGRMDPVQIYQNTQRKMGINFYIAATNPDDHDEMWYSINRLVAMVYPQWSKGIQRQDAEGNKFIQPFSQIPTASPLVRLRVGELFKTNYSDLNLERLFGIVTNAFGLVVDDAEKSQEIQEKIEAASANARALLEKANLGPPPYGDVLGLITTLSLGLPVMPAQGFAPDMPVEVTANKFPRAKSGLVPGTFEIDSAAGEIQLTEAQNREGVVKGWIATPMITLGMSEDDVSKAGQEAEQPPEVKYIVELPSLGDDPVVVIANQANVSTEKSNIQQRYINAFIAEAFAAGGAAIPPAGMPGAAGDTSGRAGIANDAEWFYAEEVRKFFSAEENAVVRSFKSAGGQGIAGVINALDFDYMIDKVGWETAPGSRAPQMVKVSIGFSPIHDIPLGLAHDGSMRAVSHPVGSKVRGLYGAPNAGYGDEAYFRALEVFKSMTTPPPPPTTTPELE